MSDYVDYPDVANFTKEAVIWNVQNGIIVGKTATTPRANITKAENQSVVEIG